MLLQPWTPSIEKVIGVGDNEGTISLTFFKVRPRLPHGQASLMQFPLQQYSDERLIRNDQTLLDTCVEIGVFEDHEFDFDSGDIKVTVYQRKAFGDLTPEEREASRLAQRQSRIDD